VVRVLHASKEALLRIPRERLHLARLLHAALNGGTLGFEANRFLCCRGSRGLNRLDRGCVNELHTRLDSVVHISRVPAPTEVDHYQIQRTVDVYVMPTGEDLSQLYAGVQQIVSQTQLPPNTVVNVRGTVQAMRASFQSFGLGLILSTVLVYLILVAQFKSFVDPFLILLAVPTGLAGVLLILFATGTTLNVMSLMGIVMMVGIVVSNSILIVEFTNRLRAEGRPLRQAVSLACRVRLRPVLMTSLATLFGLLPMAAKFGAGSEAYAPLARAIIGGLAVSVVLTVFIVPCAYYLIYHRREVRGSGGSDPEPGSAQIAYDQTL